MNSKFFLSQLNILANKKKYKFLVENKKLVRYCCVDCKKHFTKCFCYVPKFSKKEIQQIILGIKEAKSGIKKEVLIKQ